MLRKGSAFSDVLSISCPRRDRSPCSEKPRSLTGAAIRQDAHDVALNDVRCVPSPVSVTCGKSWDLDVLRWAKMGEDAVVSSG